jgi:CHAD domain
MVGPVPGPHQRPLHTGYAQARTAALQALDGKRYLRLLDDLDALLADPPLTPQPGSGAARRPWPGLR